MVLHNGTILLIGGSNNERKCLQLDSGTWKEHSKLTDHRCGHSVVATPTATFIFGGIRRGPRSQFFRQTYEYLPKDSTTWIKGKTQIPIRFCNGSAIALSEQEILLISTFCDTILCFNVSDHTFRELPYQLNVKFRQGHRSAFIPNTKKLMITGGWDRNNESINSTEILDIEDGSVTMASPMHLKRAFHGLGVITINGQDRLAAFGGHADDDSVELFNAETVTWETTEMKFEDSNKRFDCLTVKLSDLISDLSRTTY